MTLRYETLISEGVVRARGALPSGEPITSSPITSTLICGLEDAILIDPPFTTTQTQNVIDWVLGSGRWRCGSSRSISTAGLATASDARIKVLASVVPHAAVKEQIDRRRPDEKSRPQVCFSRN